ncbi:MAG: NAD(P)-dependent oxidoreductase [Micrococcaceae bacterium]
MIPTVSSNYEDTIRNLVVGSGFSGLAMAAELNRNHMEVTLISGPMHPTTANPSTSTSSLPSLSTNQIDGWKSRVEIIKHLETYIRAHKLDFRKNVHVENITPVSEPETYKGELIRWIVTTDQGTLFARNIIMAGKNGSFSRFNRYDTIQHENSPEGFYVVGRALGYGKAAIKEILAQVRRVIRLIKDQDLQDTARLQ